MRGASYVIIKKNSNLPHFLSSDMEPACVQDEAEEDNGEAEQSE